ncbi:LamG-like jellyroll fold domain-containing protein [Marinobacterium stanieri]|uniref:LamG-like jellyroll fold domain-containing protein n=1 Tax=Marinobacterium stanieri TaxID=49186 RepID=UPI0002558EEE|nr:LamG-like jellyroll fold domain-containing protein [Marinobacterium stanieri]
MAAQIYELTHPSLMDAFMFEDIGTGGEVYGENGSLSGFAYGGVSLQPAESGMLIHTDGVSGYVAIELGQIPDQFSVSAWIREDYESVGDDSISIGRPASGSGARYGVMLGYNNNSDYFGYGSGWCGYPSYPATAGLYHAVWVIDNQNLLVKKYINKQLVYAQGLTRAIRYSGTKLHIGAGAWSNGRQIIDVDDLRIFNKLLDITEVGQLYDYVFPYEISGVVTKDTLPYQASVFIYNATTGLKIAELTPEADGSYGHFLKLDTPVLVVPEPPPGYEPLIHGPVTPALRTL